MSDETTTGQHELIVGKFDPYSDEVAITRDGIVLAHVYGNDGGAVKALALDFVLGRERAQKAEAENARLRERVAALTTAISNYLHAYDWSLKAPPQDARPDELGHRRRSEMRAALAQAGETRTVRAMAEGQDDDAQIRRIGGQERGEVRGGE